MIVLRYMYMWSVICDVIHPLLPNVGLGTRLAMIARIPRASEFSPILTINAGTISEVRTYNILQVLVKYRKTV